MWIVLTGLSLSRQVYLLQDNQRLGLLLAPLLTFDGGLKCGPRGHTKLEGRRDELEVGLYDRGWMSILLMFKFTLPCW